MSLSEKLCKCVQKLLNKSRYQHSLAVAETAKKLADHWGEDPQKAELAGFLHDLGRSYDAHEYIDLCQKYGLKVSQRERCNPILLHAPLGAYMAEKELGIADTDILEAIAYHTLGKIGMSDLAKIIFLADVIEPGRQWKDTETLKELRKVAYEDLNLVVGKALDGIFNWLLECGREIPLEDYQTRDYFYALAKK
ncbi:MAG: bis(5'-nucleosyl)-tetraphosphatase (symmetrical) YqeK [Bacillota bacterium]|jgi:predicted HD superfamily hydrolase involved in NAD metabolism